MATQGELHLVATDVWLGCLLFVKHCLTHAQAVTVVWTHSHPRPSSLSGGNMMRTMQAQLVSHGNVHIASAAHASCHWPCIVRAYTHTHAPCAHIVI